MASPDPGDEPIEVVDPDGRVLEVVPRRRMRRETLRHRCTYVAVLVGDPERAGTTAAPGPPGGAGSAPRPEVDAATPVVVHQRADWKDTYPSYWDVAFGGVCGVGEPWVPAAERELAEEAGITGAPLHDLGPGRYEQHDNRLVGRIFVAWWPHEPVCGDGEVVALDRVPLGRLSAWSRTVPVCPDSAALVIPRLLGLLGDRPI